MVVAVFGTVIPFFVKLPGKKIPDVRSEIIGQSYHRIEVSSLVHFVHVDLLRFVHRLSNFLDVEEQTVFFDRIEEDGVVSGDSTPVLLPDEESI